MKPSFRHLPLTCLLLAGGLRPGLAAEPARPAATGMEWWRLRTEDVLTTGATSPTAAKKPPAAEIPGARRSVRVVYPGLVDAR